MTTTDDRPASAAPAPLAPARLPTGAGTIGWLGPLLAALLVGVAVVLGQDALLRARGATTTWLSSATSALDGLAPSTGLAAVGLATVLVGLWLLVSSLRPRTRDALALEGTSGAHLRTADAARLASRAAEDVDGVLDARCTTTRRRATVTVTTTSREAGVRDQVRAAAEQALSALRSPPRVVVRATSPSSKGDPS